MDALIIASHNWHGSGDGWWFPIFPLLFFALWIGVIVFFVRRWRSGHARSGESVLAERYARGEIDEAEYRHRQAVLQGKG